MKNASFYISVLFLLLIPKNFFAQCSDAGVCQVGHLDENTSENKFRISLGFANGKSDKETDVSFTSVQINMSYKIFPRSDISLIMPYHLISGPEGDVNGIGDLILGWTQNIISDETSQLNATLGGKFATGDENKAPNLPQVYQPGLGSNDLLFAVDYSYENFGVGLGYQLAGGRNDKQGVRLERGDDFIARALYKFSLSDVSITPQLLFIKRLSESSVFDTSSAGENFINVEKSDQSQLNLIVQFQYPLNERFSLFAEGAVPFIKREVNVDGLTRAYTFSAGVSFSY